MEYNFSWLNNIIYRTGRVQEALQQLWVWLQNLLDGIWKKNYYGLDHGLYFYISSGANMANEENNVDRFQCDAQYKQDLPAGFIYFF